MEDRHGVSEALGLREKLERCAQRLMRSRWEAGMCHVPLKRSQLDERQAARHDLYTANGINGGLRDGSSSFMNRLRTYISSPSVSPSFARTHTKGWGEEGREGRTGRYPC